MFATMSRINPPASNPLIVGRNASILDDLNPSVVSGRRQLAQRYLTAQPFPHVVIDGFLEKSFCDAIIEQFPAFDERGAINEDGLIGGKSTREEVRKLGPAYKRLDDLMRSRPFLDFIGDITGIDNLEYDPWYFGGGTHDNRHGQDLDPHIDFNYHPITRRHRRLNMIIYLNEVWREEWGGLLQLHQDPYRQPSQDQIETVIPLRNRCVIFETSERSWHGFAHIELPPDRRELSRKSFAVYFYTRRRPAAETADEHSTVYVERHLPDHFTPGLTLEQRHVEELRALLSRRDQHLKRLYDEIRKLNGKLRRSPLRRAAVTLRQWLRRLKG